MTTTVSLTWSPSVEYHAEETVYRAIEENGEPTFPEDYTEIVSLDAATGEYTDTDSPAGETIWYAVTAATEEESDPTTASSETDDDGTLGDNQYLWDADDFDVGTTPVEDWEEAYDIDSFTVQEDGDGKYLEVGNGGGRSTLRFTPPGNNVSDVEIYINGKYTGNNDDLWYYMRGQQDDTAWGHEMVRTDKVPNEDVDRLSQFDNDGSFSELETQPLTQTQTNEIFHIRARVGGGWFRGKWWIGSADDEPDDWDLETDQFTVTHDGWIGVGGWDEAIHHIYTFGVGVEGAEAPTGHATDTTISGLVTDPGGTSIEGAIVRVVNTTADNPAEWDYVNDTTTDSNGEYTIDISSENEDDEFHVSAEYDDGTAYNARSAPFVLAGEVVDFTLDDTYTPPDSETMDFDITDE